MKDILCLLINITQYEIVLHKYMRLHLLHIYLESKIREKSQAGRSKIREKSQAGRSKELHFLQCTELSSYGHIKHKCFQKKHSVFTRKLAIHTVEYCQWRDMLIHLIEDILKIARPFGGLEMGLWGSSLSYFCMWLKFCKIKALKWYFNDITMSRHCTAVTTGAPCSKARNHNLNEDKYIILLFYERC